MALSKELIIVTIALVVICLAWLILRRRKKTFYGQTFEHTEASSTTSKPLEEEDDTPYVLTTKKRIAGILFLGVWLSFWTLGVGFATREWLTLSYGDQGYVFLAFWLAIAIPGWFFVAWTIFRLLRGDHVEFQFDGDGDSGGGD